MAALASRAGAADRAWRSRARSRRHHGAAGRPSPGAAAYRVWWRRTTDAAVALHRDVPAATGAAQTVSCASVNIDDWFFGVSALSADGYESPVVFPGDAGAF